ncbi:MAG: helix-turn-helix domain-containing protein [Hyphomicrobiaceae bacterium]|nr:helix-turn-helix domain-containing protein [Hyphomicrobiaceae bacterium]
MKLLDIGEVANRTGIPASALRYYEEVGLISSSGRHGLRRQYAPEIVTQLALIALGKSAGFSLVELSGMFGPDGEPQLSRPALHRRADDLDRQIRNLTTLRNALRHVADCPAPSHMQCPTFQRLMRLAARHQVSGKSD